MNCALCGRDVAKVTEHHLIPRSKLKKGEVTPTIWICSACHRQLHVLFTNEQLRDEYNNLERLRDEPRMMKFLNWIRKQDANKKNQSAALNFKPTRTEELSWKSTNI